MDSRDSLVLRASRGAASVAIALCAACSGDDSKPAASAPKSAAHPPVSAAHPPHPGHDDSSARPSDPSVFEFVPAVIDLGVLEPNEKKEFVFEVFNRSKAPFKIASVLTGCKCLTLDHDRGTIEPGKSGKVRAKVHASFDGIRKTIATVRLTDPQRSAGTIEYRYALVPEVMCRPRKVEFGRVDAGTESEQTVQLTIQLPDDIPDPVLEPFVQHDLPIKLQVDPPTVTRTRPGMRDLVTTLHVKLKAEEALPEFVTAIILQAKTPRTFQTVMIQVTGQVAPAWHFERAALSFGVVRVGEEVARTIRFVWPGDTPPEIKELKSNVPELTVSHTVDAAHHCFVVTINCLAVRPARIDGTIQIVTSLGSEPCTLRVTARAR